MLAYCFSEDGVFTGIEEAQESPLEPGVFLMPAQSCQVAPPETPEGTHPVWDGGEWQIVAIPVSEEPEHEVSEGPSAAEIAALEASRSAAIAELRALGLSETAVMALFGAAP